MFQRSWAHGNLSLCHFRSRAHTFGVSRGTKSECVCGNAVWLTRQAHAGIQMIHNKAWLTAWSWSVAACGAWVVPQQPTVNACPQLQEMMSGVRKFEEKASAWFPSTNSRWCRSLSGMKAPSAWIYTLMGLLPYLGQVGSMDNRIPAEDLPDER